MVVMTMEDMVGKEMVWDPLLTMKPVEISDAGRWLASPDCLATKTMFPEPVRETVLPKIVAGPLKTETVTGNPEDATGGVIVTVAPSL